jgi:pimeloyl-ACP methyl ester carboxylesterase
MTMRTKPPTPNEEQTSTPAQAARLEREPVGPMSRRLHLLELRFPFEGATYIVTQPLLRILHIRGHRHAVLVLPGGMGGDGSTFFLRWGIRNLGYSVHGWAQGRNLGLNDKMLAGLRARVDELYGLFDAKISVVGWSLGGLYARMLARDKPDKVRQVITLGSPFRMVETDQFAHNMIGRVRWEKFVKAHAAELDLLRVHEHERPPITVPTTAVYSRRDGFAPWQLSIDETGPNAPNPRAQNVEICGTHTGLSTNVIALAVILDRLAQPEGQWKPFKPLPLLRGFYPPPATWTHPAASQPRKRTASRSKSPHAHSVSSRKSHHAQR